MDISECWRTRGGVPTGTPDDPVQIQGIECIVLQILNIAVPLAGVIVFIMFIIGGFKYLTAGDNPQSKESAQKTITSALLGLALLIGAWLIITLLEKFTGLTLTVFEIPGP